MDGGIVHNRNISSAAPEGYAPNPRKLGGLPPFPNHHNYSRLQVALFWLNTTAPLNVRFAPFRANMRGSSQFC